MAAGLRAPEFIGGDVDLRINVYRRKIGVNSINGISEADEDTIDANYDTNGEKCDTDRVTNDKVIERLMLLIEQEPEATQKRYSEQLGVSLITVKRMMARLQEEKIIRRSGNNRKGQWIILREK